VEMQGFKVLLMAMERAPAMPASHGGATKRSPGLPDTPPLSDHGKLKKVKSAKRPRVFRQARKARATYLGGSPPCGAGRHLHPENPGCQIDGSGHGGYS
jgi:hypothetical protein